jgi:hypothetical protein
MHKKEKAQQQLDVTEQEQLYVREQTQSKIPPF